MNRRRTLDQDEHQRIAYRLRDALAAEPNWVFAYLYGSFLAGLPFEDVGVGV